MSCFTENHDLLVVTVLVVTYTRSSWYWSKT